MHRNDGQQIDQAQRIIVPGVPVPRGGRRFSTRTSKFYTARETRTFEELIRHHTREAGFVILAECPVELAMAFFFPRPASRTNRRNANDETFRRHKPDLPNLLAGVCDALTEVAYVDDRQVARIRAAKFESAGPPRTEIILRPLRSTK